MKGFPLPLLASASCLSAAMSIENFSPALNDRFANDSSFIADSFNLSGVGRTAANGTFATLISDNVFITANHFQPGTGNSVTFFESNDPSGVSHTRTVTGGMRIGGNTDLYVGVFDAPLPTSIARYDFTTLDRTSGGSPTPVRQVSNEFLFTVGVSPTTTSYGGSVLTNLAVGENRLEFFEDDVTVNAIGSVTDSFLTIANEPTDGGFTVETHESAVNSGDSGSPAFALVDGELVLVGTATAEGSITLTSGGPLPVTVQRDSSVYSYLGNYDEEIQDFINVNFVAVPEPSTGLLITLAGLPLLRRRRLR